MKTADGKERLIRAARELLTEQGYQATSPRDIQRRGEAGQGSFYHHFESKRDLAAAALDSLLEEMSAELENRLHALRDHPGRVCACAHHRRRRCSVPGRSRRIARARRPGKLTSQTRNTRP